MYPAHNFGAGTQPPTFGPPFNPTQQQPFLQDPLIQGADPTSPEVFRQSIANVQEQVIQLQACARRVLSGIQNAYQTGNCPAHTQADISTLKQILALTVEIMRSSGVGALPVLPGATSPGGIPPVPTEQQLTERTQQSLKRFFDQVLRHQESAATAANLLSAENIGKLGK
ncbi:hypothetical protein NLJ89_g758 [Agrocybe chaxingu]|uniref:Uncharacterized protein n=1 Tax=Agrocybe chaxingu TaxID=84603 RepID=A0A9W8TFK5_9AGAR|nr:hypothetical protein NLJ89_g758 [Agrocybe chaxingu]